MSEPKHVKREHEILDYWDKHEVFKQSVSDRPEGNRYVFYDGPPFATGLPHYGHLLQSITKDVVPRYFTMKGFRVERTWGWDCHGLPIEAIVEKELDLKSREDIEKLGVRTFNEACDSKIMTYADEWKKVIRRLGRWVDMDNAYMTKDLPFMETVWWVFSELYKKGLIYEDYKIMHVSPMLETVLSNSEVSACYFDIADLTATVKLTLTSGELAGVHVLAWTTTPWTLPGNVLAAVKEDLEYVVLESEGDRYIVAKPRVAEVMKGKDMKEVATMRGADLVGATYEPLFPFYKDHAGAFRIVAGDFVTTEDGTGIVHIAPGFGEDDMELGKKEGVKPIIHVKMNGRFVDALEDAFANEGYDVKGWAVKNLTENSHVDIEMVKYLAHHGKLFAKQKLTHSYPHCWRTDVPLMNYAATSWFVRVTDLKDKMLATNKEIHWMPEHVKDGRFGKWLEGARDWSISRSRYWGTPLPIWKSDDGDVICVSSVEELKELSGVTVDDLHKHVVDDIVIEKNGKTYRRIPEVLDCWFESGAMPYAQLHYPFENQERFEHGFPASFIAEAQDQTRGWFYTLHVLANALFDMPAFKNVVVSGLIMAEDGKKMSKRLNNYPDPTHIMETYGSDALRYYLMASPVVRMENVNFKEVDVHEVQKKFVNILLNVLAFYQLYRGHDDGRTPSGSHVLDRWIMARLNETLAEQTEAMETYDIMNAARPLQTFLTDFSTWYVRRSRERLKEAGEDQKEALATLRSVLETFAKMMAPFMPFLAEEVYQGIAGEFAGGEARRSVHLEYFPDVAEVDVEVIEKMGEARAIVSRILDAREAAGRAIKQPLARVEITVPSGEVAQEYLDVILDEVNIFAADVHEGELHVDCDFALTPELVRAGMAREVVRQVNQLRKEAGLTIADRIHLNVWSESDEVRMMFDEHKSEIQEGTLAQSIAFEDASGATQKKEFKAAEQTICIGF